MSAKQPAITCEYRPGRYGQVHFHRLAARERANRAPLLLLHPLPYSGVYFHTVMPLLNAHRMVIAPDYPGYGGSSPPPSAPAVDDYALTMLELLELIGARPVNLLGFHAGCLVAIEMALRAPAAVARLVLVDVPFFPVAERAELRTRAAKPRSLGTELASLAADWDSSVTRHVGAMPPQRAFELFVESLRSGERSHWGFRAVFSYACEQKLAGVTIPARVIATQSGLREATRRAAAALPGARLVECRDITRAVFEEGAHMIAAEIEAALE